MREVEGHDFLLWLFLSSLEFGDSPCYLKERKNAVKAKIPGIILMTSLWSINSKSIALLQGDIQTESVDM